MEPDPPWRLRLLTDLVSVCFLSNAFHDTVRGVHPTLLTPLASFYENTFAVNLLVFSDLLVTLPSQPTRQEKWFQ